MANSYDGGMNPVGQRIKALRKQHKLTQSDVASFIGVQRVSVSKWESQNDLFNTPKGEHLFKLCQILKTTAEYLLYGENSYQQNPNQQNNGPTQERIASYLQRIPMITWQQIKNTKQLKTGRFTSNHTVFSHQQTSDNSYALPVVGDSMISATGPYSFPEGVTIVFDTQWQAPLYDGVFIIAVVNQEIKFRQVKFDGSKAYLNPLNNQYPKIFDDFNVLGKVTEIQMKLP